MNLLPDGYFFCISDVRFFFFFYNFEKEAFPHIDEES